MKKLSIMVVLCMLAFISSCKNEAIELSNSADAPLNKQYSQIPREEVFADAELLNGMQNRYKAQMAMLKNEIEKPELKW